MEPAEIDDVREARRASLVVLVVGALTLAVSTFFVLDGYAVKFGWLLPLGAGLVALGGVRFAVAQWVLTFERTERWGVEVGDTEIK